MAPPKLVLALVVIVVIAVVAFFATKKKKVSNTYPAGATSIWTTPGIANAGIACPAGYTNLGSHGAGASDECFVPVAQAAAACDASSACTGYLAVTSGITGFGPNDATPAAALTGTTSMVSTLVSGSPVGPTATFYGKTPSS